MKALFITRHGGPEVLQLREGEERPPSTGELSIRVQRAGVNFADVAARVGLYPDAPPPPAVVGYEVSGLVEAVGHGVVGFRAGARVLAMTRFGGYADRVVVPSGLARTLPEEMSFDEAAALPVNYLTAFHMLHHVGRVRPGARVLLHMAAGGVGLAVAQLCRAVGKVELFGTASASKHEFLRKEGVAHPIDYRTQDYAEEVRRITHGKGVDLVLDPLGGPDWRKGYKLLRPAGQLIAFGWSNMVDGEHRNLARVVTQFAQLPLYSPMGLMGGNKTVSGVNMGHLWGETELMGGHLDALLRLYREGQVRPHIDAVVPLSQGADAHRRLQARKNVGKVLLDCTR